MIVFMDVYVKHIIHLRLK